MITTSVKNLEQLLSSMKYVQWTNVVELGESIEGLIDDYIVIKAEIQTRINRSVNRETAYNTTLVIRVRGAVVMTWGCVDHNEQMQLTEWFVKAEAEAERLEWAEKRENEQSGIDAFDRFLKRQGGK